MLDSLIQLAGLSPQVLAFLCLLFASLAVGTTYRLWHARHVGDATERSGLASLKSWWVLLTLVTISILVGRGGVICLMATASLLGLREFFRLRKKTDGRTSDQLMATTIVLAAYGCVWLDWRSLFLVGVPLSACLVLPLPAVIGGRVNGFVRHVGGSSWIVLMLGFCLPHVAWLMSLGDNINSTATGAGLVLFVIVLTTMNDIGQALWGRRWGKRAVAPIVSPHKTWEGLLLGAVTTIVAATITAPWLTPFSNPPLFLADDSNVVANSYAGLMPDIPGIWAGLAGATIAVGGFFGDVTMSAVKRDSGVKDSGTLLPGQGGILDRIDSLTFTAPLTFYYVQILYGSH